MSRDFERVFASPAAGFECEDAGVLCAVVGYLDEVGCGERMSGDVRRETVNATTIRWSLTIISPVKERQIRIEQEEYIIVHTVVINRWRPEDKSRDVRRDLLPAIMLRHFLLGESSLGFRKV